MIKLFRLLSVGLLSFIFTASLAAAQNKPQIVGVYDSQGRFVGTFTGIKNQPNVGDEGVALRLINNMWVQIPFTVVGPAENGVNLFYTSSNCSGQAYMMSIALPEASDDGVGNLWFPGMPVQLLTLSSNGIPSNCAILPPTPAYVGPALSVSLSQFNWVPPFSLK